MIVSTFGKFVLWSSIEETAVLTKFGSATADTVVVNGGNAVGLCFDECAAIDNGATTSGHIDSLGCSFI